MRDLDFDQSGRRVATRVGGAASGPLVIYLHGAPSSRLDVDLLEPTALRLGIRMASLDRPGFGGSDYHDFTFASHARDVAALADLLDADRFHVFGQSAGGPYALACAALLDARVISVGVGGSGVPFVEGTTWHAALSEQEREGLSLVGIDDERATRLLAEPDTEMSRIARDSDDEVLLEYWLSHLGAADRALVRAHPDWFIAALRESQRPGQHGWARDNIVRMPTWDFDTSDIHCPVTVWYGVEDGWSLVNWLLKAVPTSTGHVLRGHGHLVPFTAPDLVLEDLVGAGKTKPA